jgi:Concanavalin A-like lectin/glucanases superfamily/Glycosyl hydrolase family 20, domain 2/Glycosyl hydrolase family 20, catalytic domain/Carbohydrate family 9 binding domain-like
MLFRKTVMGIICLLSISITGFAQPKLIAHWRLDGNYNNSVKGSYATLTGPDHWAADRLNNNNQALGFTGKGQSPKLVINPDRINSKDLSISFWIYFEQEQLQGILNQSKGITLRTNKLNNGLFFPRKADGSYNKYTNFFKFPVKQWSHVVLSWQGTKLTIFVNGRKVASDIEDHSKITRSAKPIILGDFAKWKLFGRMDEIMLFSTALNATDIKNLETEAATSGSDSQDKGAPIVYAPATNAVIKLDGILNPKEWGKVSWQDKFRHYKTGKLARHKTRFKVIRNSKGLYFAVEATGGKVVAQEKPGKTAANNIFKDDIVELFITTSIYNKPTTRQFIFNANGAQSQAFIAGNTIDWQVATRKKQHGYTAEVFIPFSLIEYDYQPYLGLNICRESRINGQTPDITSWAGVKKSFLRTTTDYGILVFGKKKSTINASEITLKIDDQNIVITNQSKKTYQADFYFYKKRGVTNHQYLSKPVTIHPGNSSFAISAMPNFSGGINFLHLFKGDNNAIEALKVIKFFSKEAPFTRQLVYANPVIFPAVKKAEWGKTVIDLHPIEKIVFYPSANGYEAKTAEKIKKYINKCGFKIKTINQGNDRFPQEKTIVLGSLKNSQFVQALKQNNPQMLNQLRSVKSPKEGYLLKITDGSLVILAGQDGAGAYYAFRTLLQILRLDPQKITETTILDWPDIATRGIFNTTGHSRSFNSESMLYDYIFEDIAGLKLNELQLSLISLDFKSNKKLGQRNISSALIKKAVVFARENFIDIVPAMMLTSHSVWIAKAYPELAAFPKEFNFKLPKSRPFPASVNPTHPDYYKIIFPLLKEVYELCGKSPIFHIGHDEFYMVHPTTPQAQAALRKMIADDIMAITKELQRLGVTEVRMWSDMLQKNFNGGPPLNFYRMNELITSDYKKIIAPMFWLSLHGKPGMAQELLKYKYKKVGWSSNKPDFLTDLPKNPDKFAFYSMNRWAGPSPRFIFPNLLEPKQAMWDKKVMGYQFFNMVYGADVFWNINTPKNLLTYTQFQQKNGTALMRICSARKHYSDINYTPLKLPQDKQALAYWNSPVNHVAFNTAKQAKLSPYKPIYIPGKMLVLSHQHRSTDITVNKKALTVAVLHTANVTKAATNSFYKNHIFFYARGIGKGYRGGPASPDTMFGPLTAKYTLNYADGTHYTTDIRLGYNIYLWNGAQVTTLPYLLYDASEIWSLFDQGQFVDAQIFVIDNPRPNKTVKSLTFARQNNSLDIAILGLGIGQKK